jgi:hypothetical protein
MSSNEELNNSARALFRRIKIPLDVARTVTQNFNNELEFPFKGIKIISASSDNATIELRVNYPIDTGSSFPMKNGEVFNFPWRVNGARLQFSAQPGEWVELLVSMEAPFPQTNSRLNIGGSIKSLDGNVLSVTNPASDIVSTGETLLVAQNLARGFISVENLSGVDMYIGNTGALLKKLAAGAEFQFRNTAAVYAKTLAGTAVKSNIIIWEEYS